MKKENSFYDSHLHFIGIGMNMLDYIDVTYTRSISELSNVVSENLHRKIIICRGWDQFSYKDELIPSKQDIEAITLDVPVILLRTCGHILVCNSKAMEIAGIDNRTQQVAGGTFDIQSGLFTENALSLILDEMPKPSKSRIKEYMIASNDLLLSHGITSVGSDDFSSVRVNYEVIIDCYKELYEENKIQVRVFEQVNLPSKELLLDFINKGYVGKTFNSFRIGPLKILADGSLGGKTAFLKKHYFDDDSNFGIKIFEQNELNELVYLADSNNMDVAIHAIGDGAIDMAINAIWNSMSRTNRTHHRHSIIHAQLATKTQISRMYNLNISVQVQPIFLNSDIAIIEKRLGKKRSEQSYLFHTMFKYGVRVSFSTDAPVETVNPFYNLYSAITRKSIKYMDYKPFILDQKFTINEAVECYTINPYYLSYNDLDYQKFNDYIILDRNIKLCSNLELLETQVIETYINGKLVYRYNE